MRDKRKICAVAMCISVLISLLGCIDSAQENEEEDITKRYPQSMIVEIVESSENEFFVLDKSKTFSFCYGWGGGPNGLKVFKLDQDGLLSIQKKDLGELLESSVKLSEDQFAKVISCINSTRLLELESVYSSQRIVDGSVQILNVSQAKKEKTVYCCGYSPMPLRILECQLDELLGDVVFNWQPVRRNASDFEDFLRNKRAQILGKQTGQELKTKLTR